jgi:TonB family protein
MSAFRHMRTQELWLADHDTAVSPAVGVAECQQTLSPSAPRRPMLAHIGRYEVQAEIGHGALVRVFRAFDREIGRPVTLKVLTDVTNRLLLERFRREVVTVASLRNASMVAIYELGEHAGLPFVVMQHLGDDLRRAIQTQRPLSLLQKMLMMWQAAEGVRAAHRSGLSYVGLRPSGIALGSDGCVAIQDFGVVRLTGGAQDAGASYASPEELAADCLPDPLCDVFAFGTVYYELLTGRHPFLVGSSDQAKIDILNHEPAPLRDSAPECPEALARFVYRALNKHRELRYQSLDDVQHDAEPILRELKRARAAVLLGDARRLMGAQELDDAQGAVRAVLELDPENRNAHRLHTAVQSLLQRRRVRSRLVALMRLADEEAANRRFGQAAEILETALRLDGAELEVKNRLEQMRSRMEQSQKSAQLVAEARSLLDQHCLTEAHGKAAEALEKDPTSVEATELLQAIGEAVRRQEREARVEQELAKAKSLLLLKSFDAATSILAGLRAECPDSPLIERWVTHARTQQAEAQRQTHLQERLTEARSLLTEQRYAEAIAKLEMLSKEFPDESQVSNLLVQARQAMERARGIAQAVALCNQFRHEEQFDKALYVLDSALATYTAEPAILARRREVEEQSRAAREEEQFYNSGREKALTLIQQQLFEQAADLLCNLLALFPGDPTLERDLRCAQGREQDRHEDTVLPSAKLGEPETCEMQAEPSCQRLPARLAEAQSPVAAPARARWAMIAAAALFLLVSASAAVWKFSRNEFQAPGQMRPTPDSAQLSVTREVQGQVATPTAPAPSSVVPGSGKMQAKIAPAEPRPALDRLALLRPDVAPTQESLFLHPTGAVPIASEWDTPRLPANVLGPVDPSQPPQGERQNASRVVIAAAAPSRSVNFQESKFISGPSPVIPPVARELGIRGDVNLEATVDRRGAVTNVTILSGHPLLFSAVTNAVLEWRFQPATLNGQPLEVRVRIQVIFEAERKQISVGVSPEGKSKWQVSQ